MKRTFNWFQWRENVIDFNEEKMEFIKMKRKCNWLKWRENGIDLNEEKMCLI